MTVEAAARALVEALERCRPYLGDVFAVLAVHGVKYDGPTYHKELQALQEALDDTSQAISRPGASLEVRVVPMSEQQKQAISRSLESGNPKYTGVLHCPECRGRGGAYPSRRHVLPLSRVRPVRPLPWGGHYMNPMTLPRIRSTLP